MSRSAFAASTDPTPTPAPASDEHLISERRRHIDELIERHAHARSVDELPPELRDNPMIVAIVSMTPEQEARDIAVCEAHKQAHELYGDDPARVLAAFEAGTHPLQRLELADP
jgi:hypothetical protein